MADSVVEPSSSSSVSSMQGPQSTTVGHSPINQNSIAIISGDIQMDNVPRPPPSSAVVTVVDDTEEPDIKRKKLDPAFASTSQSNEKLESRLGGILCCAVCLDLPKTAMYQVGDNFYT